MKLQQLNQAQYQRLQWLYKQRDVNLKLTNPCLSYLNKIEEEISELELVALGLWDGMNHLPKPWI